MNSAENKKVLEFIEGLLPKEGGIYYDDSKLDTHWYFYTGLNVEIKIFSIGDMISFKFLKDKEKQEFSVNIPFSEAEPLLDEILKKYQSYHTNIHLINSKVKVDKNDFHCVRDYLKNNDLENIIENSHEEYKLNIKNSSKTYDLAVKRVLNYDNTKRKVNNLQLLKIPMVTKDGITAGHAYCEFIIPGWKLHTFKAYNSVFYNDLSVSSEQQFTEKLKELSAPMANLYLYQSLNSQLPENISSAKNIKI